MRRQKGLTIIEVTAILALASVIAMTTLSYSIPWIAREKRRGVVYEVQSLLHLTKMEAVARNRDCRFVVDTATGDLQILDGNGTTIITDDILLYQSRVPPQVSFARPDAGDVVTLDQIDTSKFQTLFRSDGTVASGSGSIVLYGGDGYESVSVYGAGGVESATWNGESWDGTDPH